MPSDHPTSRRKANSRYSHLSLAFAALANLVELIFSFPSTFLEFDGTNLTIVPPAPNAQNDSSFYGNMLVLPTGQILFTDFFFVSVYNPTGSYNPAWAPRIQSAPARVSPGGAYIISGHLFNGMSQGLLTGTIGNRQRIIRSSASPTTQLDTYSIAGPTTTAAWGSRSTVSYRLISMCHQTRSSARANLSWWLMAFFRLPSP